MNTKKIFVLEGVGYYWQGWFWKAVKSHLPDEILLWVVDRKPECKCYYYRHNARGEIFPIPESIIYLDKSNRKDNRKYEQLFAHVVFVATPDESHCEVAKKWLNNAELIIVEKAFAPTEDDIKNDLLTDENRSIVEAKVKGVDNFLIRALPLKAHIGEIVHTIGGLNRIEMACMETGWTEPRDLPGMIQDLVPHMISPLSLIDDINNIEIKKVRCGRFLGAYLTRGVETFAEIIFSFTTRFSGRLECNKIYLGKGIGHKDEKYLDLIGDNGLTVRTSFLKEESNIALGHRDGRKFIPHKHIAFLPYNENAHGELARRLIIGTPDSKECYFDIATAMKIVKKIEEANGLAEEYIKNHSIEKIRYHYGDDVDTILRNIPM